MTIQWTAANVDVAGPTKITLGYDADATPFDTNEHWLEIDGVTAANGAGSYSWNTAGVAAGTYYLSGYMYDFAMGQQFFVPRHVDRHQLARYLHPCSSTVNPVDIAISAMTAGDYAGNEAGRQFWNRCGWAVRDDLQVLQRWTNRPSTNER